MQTCTSKNITDLTDAGLFERLATAVVRAADARYASLAHPGVNTEGKTIKSPVDGIAFVPSANPPHMIAVHHTISGRDQLQGKWLHDPSTVIPRKKGGQPTQPAGDVLKTLEIFKQQQGEQPGLVGTLILTSAHEPPEALVRAVNTYVHGTGLAIDIWSGSRLAQFLDTDATGQMIRRQYFGIVEDQLSLQLLITLSRQSIEPHLTRGDAALWVDRKLDQQLADANGQGLTFLVADSGLGKTVACLKRLNRHIDGGGMGIVLAHEVVESAHSLDNAVETALRQLHPSLEAGCGAKVRTICSPSRPFMIVVEDINKSGRGSTLVEKISGWREAGGKDKHSAPVQILCPVWPQLISAMGQEAQKRVSQVAIWASPFNPEEGVRAVITRRLSSGALMTELEARSISEALGHDPLLIALHDPASPLDPERVLEGFVDSSARSLAGKGAVTASEVRDALRTLASAMMLRRVLNPAWMTLQKWGSLSEAQLLALKQAAIQREVVHLAGPDDTITFRHDRVRTFLLTDAASQMLRDGTLQDDLMVDPYFAEVVGGAVASAELPAGELTRISAIGPLELFYALKAFREPQSEGQIRILDELYAWAKSHDSKKSKDRNLRWQILLALENIDSSHALPLCDLLKDHAHLANRVKLRRGDLLGGLNYCLSAEPGVRYLGQEQMFDHVRARYGTSLVAGLDSLLRKADLPGNVRLGAIRFAGYLGDPALAPALGFCWNADEQRAEQLDEYLFACAECANDTPAPLLDPICDAWALLPEEEEEGKHISERNSLASDRVKWAFERRLPVTALHYFVERAKTPDLRWPISYMLKAIDHPDAVEFTAREITERSGDSGFAVSMHHDWTRRQEETGEPLSPASKARLRELWRNLRNHDHLRIQAFRLWALTMAPSDLAELMEVPSTDLLAENALWHRLKRGDHSAIPMMLPNLHGEHDDYWWQLGRDIWSDAMTEELDKALATIPQSDEWHHGGWMKPEMLMRLPVATAESLLVRHWARLRRSNSYIYSALYVATSTLRQLVAETLAECPDPAECLKFLLMHFGYKTAGHPGIRSLAQMEALSPYLGYLTETDIANLWKICNERGWYAYRKTHLDQRLPPDGRDAIYLDEVRAHRSLDKEMSKYPYVRIGNWVDNFVVTGASLDTVMDIIGNWLAKQSDPKALSLVVDALVESGRRSHLPILHKATNIPAEAREGVIEDTIFAVKRHSLQ